MSCFYSTYSHYRVYLQGIDDEIGNSPESFLAHCIFILDLGNGWTPAVVNSPEELILIHKIQEKMNDNHSYWIGGSTYIKDGDPVTFYDYMPNLIGKKILSWD